jgi:hypothetical protein
VCLEFLWIFAIFELLEGDFLFVVLLRFLMIQSEESRRKISMTKLLEFLDSPVKAQTIKKSILHLNRMTLQKKAKPENIAISNKKYRKDNARH